MTEPQFDLDVTLSLFDGISCGQEALKRAGISTRIFLASEIEKYPKMITRKNHPLTVQLGDVTKVVADDLPHVNLLMGGSPCQGFSFAGKQLNFDDPRSALFFEFVRLLKECKPDYFLLENVMMKQEYQDIISEHLGVEPVMINSALVSAQNRKRLYWTNIPGVSQPKDEGFVLNDIIQDNVTDSFAAHRVNKFESTMKENPKISKNGINQLNSPSFSQHRVYGTDGKAPTLLAGNSGGGKEPCKIQVPLTQPKDKGILLEDVLEEDATEPMLSNIYGGFNEKKPRVHTGKSVTIRAASGGGHIPSVTLKQPKDKGILLKDILENGIADIVTNQGKTTHKQNIDKAACLLARDYKGFGNQGMTGVRVGRIVGRKINPETGKRDDYNPDLKAEQRLEPRLDEKTGTLTTVQKDNVVIDGPTYRKLTPIECERLQTLPDNYTEGVSNTQRYKGLGNGWTVDVIVHILQGIKVAA